MSNSIAIQQRREMKLSPDNNLPTFAPVSSQNILKFTIADTQALLMTKDMRLNFKVQFFKDASRTPVALSDDINVDANTGMSSLIDQLYISSLRFNTGQSLEAIHNCGRLGASMYGALFSPKHQRSNVFMEQKSVGKASFCEEDTSKATSSDANDPFKIAQRKVLLGQEPVSLRLNSGVLMSQPAGLDLNQIGGVRLDIFLAPTIAQVLYGSDVSSSAFYEISDVSLTCPLLYKSADQIAQDRASPKTSLSFLNYVSIYGVIDSTISTLSHKLNFDGLVSLFSNSIQTDHINSLTNNNMACENFGSIRSLRFSKNGQRSPLEYDLVPDRETDDTPSNEQSSTYSQIVENYLGAFKTPEDVRRTSVCNQTLIGQPSVFDGNFGIGYCLTPSTRAGIPVSGNLSMNFSTKLEDSDNSDRSNQQAYGIYTYYLNRSTLATIPNRGIVAVN